MEALKEQFEQLLAKLDAFFRLRNARERIIIFALPIFFFAVLSYQYITPALEKEYRTVSQKLSNVSSEMETYHELVDSRTGGSRLLEKITGENDALKERIAAQKDLTLYVDSRLRELNFVEFDAANWSGFLHQMVTYSTKNSLYVNAFSNTRHLNETANTGFKKVLTVDFNSTGDFYNIMKFIADIENDRAIADIETLTMESSRPMKTDFTISLWGLVN
jgi:hypothetical protein